MAVTIYVNGKREEADGPVALADLLERLKIRPEVCTVALNRSVVKRDALPDTVAEDGDTVEVMIQLAGGSDV